MKNTKQTIKQMFLAASVALTMGTAVAGVNFNGTTDTGHASGVVNPDTSNLPTDFEFSMPGIGSISTGAGLNALTQTNNVLNSVGNTQGSAINNDNFWKSFISPVKVQIFYFDNAREEIEELIYTVTGETWQTDTVAGTSGYSDATAGNHTFFASKATNVDNGTGFYQNSQLKAKGDAGVSLLTKLGFTFSGTLGDYTSSTDGTEVVMGMDPSTSVNPSASRIQQVSSQLTSASDAADHISLTDISDAKVSATGFNNANKLIAQIANELKNGYILDVEAATAAISGIVEQHNEFLGASVVENAKLLKGVIKNIGLQVAAVEVGKTINTLGSCGAGAGSDACVKVGQKFNNISSRITNLSVSAADYNTALDNIDAFADSIIAFNGVAGTYGDGSNQFADISTQFGTISVDENTQLYADLEAAFDLADLDGDNKILADGADGIAGNQDDETAPDALFGFDTWTDAADGTDEAAITGLDGFNSALNYTVTSEDVNGNTVTTVVDGVNLH